MDLPRWLRWKCCWNYKFATWFGVISTRHSVDALHQRGHENSVDEGPVANLVSEEGDSDLKERSSSVILL